LIRATTGGPLNSPLAAAPDAILAVAYLTAWAVPGAFASSSIGTLMLLIEIEALVVMTAVTVSEFFLSDRGIEFFGVLVLVLLATIVVKEFLNYGFWWPLVAFAGLLFNRLQRLLRGQVADLEVRVTLRVAAIWSLVAYLGAALASRFLPALGAGLDVAAIAEHARWCGAPNELAWFLFGNGKEPPKPWMWCVAPHRALACGFLYFTATAVHTVRVRRIVLSGVSSAPLDGSVDNPDKLT